MTYALIKFTVTSSPHSHSHAHPHADSDGENASVIRIQRIAMFFESHFGEVELHMPSEGVEEMGQEKDDEPALLVRLDEADALIRLISMVNFSALLPGSI